MIKPPQPQKRRNSKEILHIAIATISLLKTHKTGFAKDCDDETLIAIWVGFSCWFFKEGRSWS